MLNKIVLKTCWRVSKALEDLRAKTVKKQKDPGGSPGMGYAEFPSPRKSSLFAYFRDLYMLSHLGQSL